MSPGNVGLDSTVRTVVRSQPGDKGYCRLQHGPGEPHLLRTDLMPGSPPAPVAPRLALAELVHITDFQIANFASRSRVEFLQRQIGQEPWRRMLPAVRPQEFLVDYAVETVVRTIRRAAADGTIHPDLVVATGDHADSAQLNEVRRYLRLLDGGPANPDSNGDFAATPTGSGDPNYWTPDPDVRDLWSQRRGFPKDAAVIWRAREPFTAVGLGMPWLACSGNHDRLVQGRTTAPAGYDEFLCGDRKPVGLAPDDRVAGDAIAEYQLDPYRFSHGPDTAIVPRPERRLVSPVEWMGEHFGAGGTPDGHGFTRANLTAGTTWYCYDEIPGLRLIALDTTNPAGGVDGCLSDVQTRWLTDRLAEVHSHYIDAQGRRTATGNADRLVILLSHHGLATMTNDTGAGTWCERLHLAAEVEALLHRFHNVVLWLSGHIHVNKVTPRRRPGGGFWEIATSSLCEWPVQARSVGLSIVGSTLTIRSTMLDSDAPARAAGTYDLAELAALHREIAANDDGSVGGRNAQGAPEDRNVDLLVPLAPGTVAAVAAGAR